MNNDLWQIVLKETFFSADLLVLLIVPVVAFIIAVLIYKNSPLKSTGAWHNVGRRYLMLGCVLAGITIIIYLASVLIAYSRKDRANETYTTSLQTRFRDYYSARKNYTQRLMDFAQRIGDTKVILTEMDNFATNLPREERVKFGRTWSASKHGGNLIRGGIAFKGIEDMLYWPDERIDEYKQKNNGIKPGLSDLRYTKEQIDEFLKSDWTKLYPMLEQEQWIMIKNQILDIKTRDGALGFLRDISDCFQTPNPTVSLNSLYDRLASKACQTEMQKVEIYLEDSPKLLAFYKFSLQNRWWFRTVVIAIIYTIIGLIVILNGNMIAKNGKKNFFK